MVDIKVPTIGESIKEVTLLKWTKQEGDWVERDEVIAELESEKATFELNAEKAGILIKKGVEGDTLQIGDLIAQIDETATRPEKATVQTNGADNATPQNATPQNATPQNAAPQNANQNDSQQNAAPQNPAQDEVKATPVASAIIADKNMDVHKIIPSGAGGKILKQDVLEAISGAGKNEIAELKQHQQPLFSRELRAEKMSPLRKTISRRLVEAKNTAAMLTTFNEVDMTSIMETRKAYKDAFKEHHGVNLGFMSFFAKAAAIALGEWPTVNARIEGDQIVFHQYADISIAVSTPRGLTVPVIRNVESLSMAAIEKSVLTLAGKARDSKLTAEDLSGGTFTITNGGVFGSLMSTPIINAPQSAILGMHKIQDRPIAINGQVQIRPMMYLALSYDHRIIDGKESVSFLVRVKELLENPELLLTGKEPMKALLGL